MQRSSSSVLDSRFKIPVRGHATGPGHPTSTHEKLEHLLVHILAKHKTSILTPEVRAKVRCATGALVSKQAQEWDIYLPDLQGKRVG